MKDRICEKCVDSYNPSNYTAKYCPRCSPLMMQEKGEKGKAAVRSGLKKNED